MNRLAAFFASIILLGVCNLASAQAVSSSKAVAVSNPTIHNINMRLRKDMMLIQKDTHSGKLSATQATTLKAKVKAVRKQELAFMKTNGNKQLTASQETQLEQSLGQLEPTL